MDTGARTTRFPAPSATDDVAGRAARSQRLYTRIVTRAAAARARDFRVAREQGLGVDGIAAAAGLEPDEVQNALSDG